MLKRPRKSKYNINHDFFKTWSSDMAYILGLWFSDGYICNGSRYIFGITLDKKDKYLLKDILKIMRSTHKLYLKKNTFSIGICSNEIVNDIISIGGSTRKSLTIKFPEIPKEYVSDFIRGVFDGDGSVYKLKYRRGYASNIVSASRKFIISLKHILEHNICDFKCCIVEKLPTTSFSKDKSFRIASKNKSYCLELSSNNTRRLRDFIYRNDGELRLKRKYKKHILNGKINLSNSDKKFLPYNKVVAISRSLGLKTNREWYKYFHKNACNMIGVPCHPEVIYKDKWNGWGCWLGKQFNDSLKEKHD